MTYSAAQVRGGASLTLRNVDVVGGETEETGGGGCVFVEQSHLEIEGGRVSDCTVRVIRRSDGRMSSDGSKEGGGISIDGGSVRLRDMTIENTLLEGSGDVSVAGGGLHVRGTSTVATLVGVTFRNTEAKAERGSAGGGGVVVEGGDLNITGCFFVGCAAYSRAANAYGGGLAVREGAGGVVKRVHVEGTSFDETRAVSEFGGGFGGGVGVLQRRVTVRNCTFHKTFASSVTNRGYAGGMGTSLGEVYAEDVRFIGTWARSNLSLAFGGGLAQSGGQMEVVGAYFEDTEAYTTGEFAPGAFGGGIGIASGRCDVRDAELVRTSTAKSRRGGRGGGVGMFAGRLELFNVSITNATIVASPPSHGQSIAPSDGQSIDLMTAAQFRSTFLTIRSTVGDCDGATASNTPTIASSATTAPLLRAFRPDVCDRLLLRGEEASAPATCEDSYNTCGPEAECRNTNHSHGSFHFVTPTCTCPDGTFAAPGSVADLAPYIDTEGCRTPLREQRLFRRVKDASILSRKTPTDRPNQTLTFNLDVVGTDWSNASSNGRPLSYVRWNASVDATSKGGRWIHIINPSGHVERPGSGNGTAEIRVRVDTAGVPENVDAYEANLYVRIELPPDRSLATNATPSPREHSQSANILFWVYSQVVPERCELRGYVHPDTEQTRVIEPWPTHESGERRALDVPLRPAGQGRVRLITFVVKDIDGLPMSRGTATSDLSATLCQCYNSSCTEYTHRSGNSLPTPSRELCKGRQGGIQFAGDGEYDVRVRLLAYSHYQLLVTYGDVQLPFKPVLRGVCDHNQYMTNGVPPIRQGLLPACLMCDPNQINCTWPSFLETLDLKRDHWRPSNRTSRIYRCNTVGVSRCTGGVDPNSYCAEGFGGPRCAACVHPGMHRSDDGGCALCDLRGVASMLPIVGYALGLVLAIYSLRLLWRRRQSLGVKTYYVRLAERFVAHCSRLGLVAKVKIVVSYYQIIVTFPAIYGEVFDDVYVDVMEAMRWLALDWVHLGPPPACIGDYRTVLWIKTIGPFGVLLFVVALGSIGSALRLLYEQQPRRPSGPELRAAMQRGAVAMLPVTFIALFAAVPGVSNRLFLTFQYDECTHQISDPRAARGVCAVACACVRGHVLWHLAWAWRARVGLWEARRLPLPNRAQRARLSRRVPACVHAVDFPLPLLAPADILDDETGERAWYIGADPRTKATGEEYTAIVWITGVFIFLWTGLVPLFFWVLLRLSNRPGWSTILSDSVGFLYTEYRRELYWWELLELTRKILLAGYVFLLEWPLLRALRSLLLTIGHLGLLIQAKPYRCSARTPLLRQQRLASPVSLVSFRFIVSPPHCRFHSPSRSRWPPLLLCLHCPATHPPLLTSSLCLHRPATHPRSSPIRTRPLSHVCWWQAPRDRLLCVRGQRFTRVFTDLGFAPSVSWGAAVGQRGGEIDRPLSR